MMLRCRLTSLYIRSCHTFIHEACFCTFLTIKTMSQEWVAKESLISFSFKLFDHVTEREITLTNTGKVGFEFKVLTDPQSSPDNLLPGVPVVLPLSVSKQWEGPEFKPTSPTPMQVSIHGQDYKCDFFFLLKLKNSQKQKKNNNKSKPLHSFIKQIFSPSVASFQAPGI